MKSDFSGTATSFCKTAKVVLVSNVSRVATLGGRGLLSKLNRDALREIFRENLTILELVPNTQGDLIGTVMAVQGHIDGVEDSSLERLFQIIKSSPTWLIFIDGSNLGEVARAVKQRFPDIEIITFCHNVEARFFLGALRHSWTPRALGVLLANYLAERKAVRHSDKLVALSDRDRLLFGRLYGRRATHVAPMALHDQSYDCDYDGPTEGKYALFVGGAFYANHAGIAWYADKVAPRLRLKTYVVGHGFERMKERLERFGNIEVVGSVTNLAGWYRKAHVVVAPIFDGSGMKTKVAEALMFGKRVVGTPEAFSGYEDALPAAGEICREADEFVAALHRTLHDPFCTMNQRLREIFVQNYSYPAACRRLHQIIFEKAQSE